MTRRSSSHNRSVTVAVATVLIVGLAGVASAAAESAPAPPPTAVAGSVMSVTGAQLDRAARTLGYDTVRFPAAAWTANCLAARGVKSSYNDADGSFTVEGDGPELLECTKELAAKSAG